MSSDLVGIVERLLAAIQKAAPKPGTTSSAPVSPDVDQLQKLIGDLQRTIQLSTVSPSVSSDPVGIVERLLAAIQKAAPKPGTTASAPVSPDFDQLQRAIALLTAILGKPPLGQVNGALGETIGNLLNGKENGNRNWRFANHKPARRRYFFAQCGRTGRTSRNRCIIGSGPQPICVAYLPCDNGLGNSWANSRNGRKAPRRPPSRRFEHAAESPQTGG